MDSFKKRKKSFLYKYKPGQIMVLGFAGVILAGTLILMLPISSNSGEITNFFDCLFTATSSVCVTGLVVLDTSLHWSVFGKTVIILLIQIGGMGFMSIGALISFIFGTKINIRKRILLQESLNQNQLSGVVRLIRRVLIFTVSIEFVGALLLSTVFIPQFGLIDGIGYSIFHSISAFCNAGFDLMGRHSGEFSSMLMFYNNSIVVLTLSVLVILGGIGFPVLICIKYNKLKFKKYDLSSKLAIITTIILLIIGTMVIFCGEFSNASSIGTMSIVDKLKVAFFQSMTARTAGFATIDFNSFRANTLFVLIVLMFIGASPASTGGGIKTTTLAVIFISVISFLRNENDINVFKRRVDVLTFRKALGVFFIAIAIFVVGTYVLTITQNEKFGLMQSAFEVSSSLATVGLSMAGSSNLNLFGKVFISLLMFLGRVGSLTVFTYFMNDTVQNKIRYPEEKILIG